MDIILSNFVLIHTRSKIFDWKYFASRWYPIYLLIIDFLLFIYIDMPDDRILSTDIFNIANQLRNWFQSMITTDHCEFQSLGNLFGFKFIIRFASSFLVSSFGAFKLRVSLFFCASKGNQDDSFVRTIHIWTWVTWETYEMFRSGVLWFVLVYTILHHLFEIIQMRILFFNEHCCYQNHISLLSYEGVLEMNLCFSLTFRSRVVLHSLYWKTPFYLPGLRSLRQWSFKST